MKDAHALIFCIEQHLADDKKQLAAIERQADAVTAALNELMMRLRREIDASSASIPGACHLRG
jgi:hypothetical protein